ncbi:MAG: hypothetical protein V3V96_14235, partial [Acidiferrobacterales bacterium]
AVLAGFAVLLVIAHLPANTSAQAAPSRVETWQAESPDDLRAELAGRAMQGLLSNQWLIDSVQAMIFDLHNGQPGLTDLEVNAWFKAYVGFHAVAFADATLEMLDASAVQNLELAAKYPLIACSETAIPAGGLEAKPLEP